ncbi:MAG: prepilin peptidase [Candidatus Moranbacteria bacterium]|nr:prepilin peptidase [Candidatus Moranbacteria bacterium]
MLAFFFIAGLIVGSFLNVVIFRLESGEDFIGGRSKCRSCGTVICWYDNIPILSFVMLRGKCRFCDSKISWQYPIVEFATGLLFLFVGVYIFMSGNIGAMFDTALALGLIPALVVVFVYDLRHMEIPVSVLAFGMIWVLFMLFFRWIFVVPMEPFFSSRLFSGIVGGAVAFLFLYSLVFFSKETWMGSGDAWLASVLGFVSGWELLLHAFTLAFGSGALVGIVLLALRKRELGGRIPFGPFLSASVIIFLFFGRMIGKELGFYLWM